MRTQGSGLRRQESGKRAPRLLDFNTKNQTDAQRRKKNRKKKKMGVEKEKADTCVFMDEDVFHSTIEPMLKKNRENARALPLPDRDPRDTNAHLKVNFQDVIGEPASVHSLDSVWIGSHALFELVKWIFYRVLTTLLAVPMALLAGLVFAVLSCAHIWIVMPLVHSCMMTLPPIQLIWSSLVETLVRPLFRSMSVCLYSIGIKSCESEAP